MAAAAAAAKTSARRRHGKKNQDFYENLENEKIAKNIEKNLWKLIKTSILEELGKNDQILQEKLLYIDLFACLYNRKWPKTLPVHVPNRSYHPGQN